MYVTKNTTFTTNYKQLSIKYDPSHEVVWSFLNQNGRVPCFNPELLTELTQHHREIEQSGGIYCDGITNKESAIKYAVAASLTENVFNLGGQLSLMRELNINKNYAALEDYAFKSIEALAQRIFRFKSQSIVKITLLQGKALGAGLEAALTSDIIIAERKSTVGFPEILFNSFPGMGGYSLAARKVGQRVASELLTKGKIYSAEEAHDMGLIDILVDDGKGVDAVYNWIDDNNRHSAGFMAIQRAKERVHPITYEELMDITKIWLHNASQLTEHDLSIMERFALRQEMQYATNDNPNSHLHSLNGLEMKKMA